MMRHLLRRLGFYLVALWASLTINFLIPRLAPGDPAQTMIGQMRGQVSPQEIQSLRELLGEGSTANWWTQYGEYFGNLLHGNLGISSRYFPATVVQMISQGLFWTLGLVGMAVAISFFLGTLLGVFVAWRRNSWLDSTLTPLFTFLAAIPYFWFALILVYTLGYTLRWFPEAYGYDVFTVTQGWNMAFLLSVMQHAFLPALAIVVSSISGWLLAMRNTMLTTLSEDYVLLAQAKGLSERRIMVVYAARNAVLPSITGFALSLGFVISGSLLTEIVFSYPGIGYTLLQAVQNNDYALIQGIFLCVAVAILASNFLVDLVYVFLDPRVRQERG